MRTNTTGGVSNAYFNLNGTDYFRISTESTQTGLRNLTNTPLYFSINNTEQMRLTSTGLEVKQSQLIGYSSYAGIGTNGLAVAGNVGIGTSSPTQKLDVVGNIRGSGNLFAGFGNANASVQVLSSVSAGGAGNSELYFGNATNSTQGYLSYSHSTNALLFGTNTTTQMTLNSSGNLGLGVPPSAWRSGDRALDIGSTASLVDAQSANTRLYNNTFVATGGTNTYKITAAASYYDQGGGAHRWFTAPSGTAGNAISFTQAMTLDASGNLLVGTTSNTEGAKLNVQNGYVFVKESGGGDLYIRSGVGAGVDPAIQVASNDPLLFYTNNTERARITSGGDLLVGRPAVVGSEKLSVNGGARLETFADIIGGAGTPELRLYQNSGNWSVRNSAGALAFYDLSGSAERARINNGGDLLVGTQTSLASYRLQVASGAISGGIFQTTAAGSFGATAWNTATAGDNLFFGMFTEGTATQRGSIDYNRAGGLVRYNTTSDYRAKDILGPVADPGATIDALKVYEGRMKGATQSRPMLVAHEAQEHAPYAVSGVKDEVNDDGTPKFQQIDVSSLVPLLIAEIQSLRARVAALEAK